MKSPSHVLSLLAAVPLMVSCALAPDEAANDISSAQEAELKGRARPNPLGTLKVGEVSTFAAYSYLPGTKIKTIPAFGYGVVVGHKVNAKGQDVYDIRAIPEFPGFGGKFELTFAGDATMVLKLPSGETGNFTQAPLQDGASWEREREGVLRRSTWRKVGRVSVIAGTFDDCWRIDRDEVLPGGRVKDIGNNYMCENFGEIGGDSLTPLGVRLHTELVSKIWYPGLAAFLNAVPEMRGWIPEAEDWR